MPEIAEVEAFKEYVKSNCLHMKLTQVNVNDAKLIHKISAAQFKKNLSGSSFSQVERRGKYLIINVDPSNKKLVMHFGLTGFLVVSHDPDEQVRFSQVSFIFKKLVLHWCDVRKFGKLWLVNSANEVKGISELGIDAMNLSLQKFMDLAHKSAKKNIKTFLMDQSIIAGIGNEYSDEILFQAGIDPRHKIQDLSAANVKKIYQKMKVVLKYAIGLRVKNINKFTKGRLFTESDSKIFKSSYLQAHRHGDMHCPKNKNHMLKRITIGGRSAYYCPYDQK